MPVTRRALSASAAAREQHRRSMARYDAAAEQLGSDVQTVRLAGVRAMAELADEGLVWRRPCVAVLCALLRRWCPQEPAADERTAPPRLAWSQEQDFRLAIVEELAERLRLPAHDARSWRGIVDLAGVEFERGGFLVRAGGLHLQGTALLAGDTED